VTNREENASPRNGGGAAADRTRRRVHSLVTLLAAAMLVACSPSATDEASPNADPMKVDNAHKVTLDGQDYIEYDYRDVRVQVPLSQTGGLRGPTPLSWLIPLPSDLRERGRSQIEKQVARGYHGFVDDMRVILRLSDVNQSTDPAIEQFETQDPLLHDLVETRADWGLALYRRPEWDSHLSRPGEGYWMPTDPAMRQADGSSLVITCWGYSPKAGGFPHGLECGWETSLSERVFAQFTFRGTYLGDWQRIYEVGTSNVQQRVRAIK
jgi:hypothetical protein